MNLRDTVLVPKQARFPAAEHERHVSTGRTRSGLLDVRVSTTRRPPLRATRIYAHLILLATETSLVLGLVLCPRDNVSFLPPSSLPICPSVIPRRRLLKNGFFLSSSRKRGSKSTRCKGISCFRRNDRMVRVRTFSTPSCARE